MTSSSSKNLVAVVTECFAEDLDALRTSETITEEKVKSLIDALEAGAEIFSPAESSLLSCLAAQVPKEEEKGGADKKKKATPKKKRQREEQQ